MLGMPRWVLLDRARVSMETRSDVPMCCRSRAERGWYRGTCLNPSLLLPLPNLAHCNPPIAAKGLPAFFLSLICLFLTPFSRKEWAVSSLNA